MGHGHGWVHAYPGVSTCEQWVVYDPGCRTSHSSQQHTATTITPTGSPTAHTVQSGCSCPCCTRTPPPGTDISMRPFYGGYRAGLDRSLSVIDASLGHRAP